MAINESKTVRKCYFAGANTGMGFRSFYSDIFPERELSGLYIIKGGPGTGKSTFLRYMRDFSLNAGLRTEEYICGSDEGSLDGILIFGSEGKSIGIIDGTPPHPREFISPGAAGDILDFGMFWDSVGLSEVRGDIDRLAAEKSACYGTAYRYLGATSKVREHIFALTSEAYIKEKAHGYIKRLLSSVGTHGECIHLQTSGFTSSGIVETAEISGRKYTVTGDRYMADIFMKDLLEEAVKGGIGCEVSYSTVEMKYPDRIRFTGTDITVLFGEDHDADKIINMKRFTDKDILSRTRQKIRFGKKCSIALLDGAKESLVGAREKHMELENIYGRYMNFDALKKMEKKWTDKIMARLL